MADTTTNKRILLKDADGNPLYPEVQAENIPDGSLAKGKLTTDLQTEIDNKAKAADVYTKTEVDNKLKTTVYYQEVTAS